ncbi:mitochondrial 54S ribosomal protein uL15m [Ascoidea rubescens DSM 1968]|uniref:Ribosomal protein L15 n=1 Tax=Ascoidea rubescens DSM 1968 TaxID=1344418 RepID=A0A1D2VSA8_9ASCO|nr:ribosomal protein L15 [Ascoidea rubescens DSM 1968]ODV64493.1 ribosomal protein L15 [Ascoidea rubescens DSM 1968]
MSLYVPVEVLSCIKGFFVASRKLSLLSNLTPSKNSTRKFKRVGRGPGSGRGKTSTRGQKGQKARGSVQPWFEGGQTPITRLFRKIGFKTNKLKLDELNLERIQHFYLDGRLSPFLENNKVLDMRGMKQIGLITSSIRAGIKIIGRGKEEFSVPNLRIEANRASKDAVAAIEKCGGDFTARYFTPSYLRSHLNPNKYLEKYGRLPLPPRPTKQKDIDYYSDMENRGYLIKENDPYLKLVRGAASTSRSTASTKKTALESQAKEIKAQSKPIAAHKSNLINLQQYLRMQ